MTIVKEFEKPFWLHFKISMFIKKGMGSQKNRKILQNFAEKNVHPKSV